MQYRLLEWDAQTQSTRKIMASEHYDEIWDAWVAQPANRLISCKLKAGAKSDGKRHWYLVTAGRKPGIYNGVTEAMAQTDGIGGKPEGYPFTAKARLIQDWLNARIDRREARDVEIVRKSCGCCWYCGTTLVTAYGKHLGKGQRDHQTSRVNNGGNEIENLVLACERCNTAEKNSLNLEEYRAKLLALRPQDYPEGKVIFFGERPRTERHRIKRDAEPGWKCPAEEEPEIPCLEDKA